ncbi:hypothetical protein K8I28_14345 [bacterium]|nr:hypothetical protein [bacterium]
MVYLLAQGILLWFIVVFIEQKHNLDMRDFVIWVALALVVPYLFDLLVFAELLDSGLGDVLILSVTTVLLAFVLYFRFDIRRIRNLTLILLIFFGINIAMGGLVMLLTS